MKEMIREQEKVNKFPEMEQTNRDRRMPAPFCFRKGRKSVAEKTKISERLDENIAHMEELFHTCDDIKKKRMNLGKTGTWRATSRSLKSR